MKPADVRRAEALTRNTAWAALSPEQQLQRLDALGLAAKQQRARLCAQLSRLPAPARAGGILKDDRCIHGMFYSGAGACPQCGGGAVLSDAPKPEKKPRHKKGKRGDGRHA